ncbi:hypothetical protein O4U47_19110 [Nocardiopsis sp. LSu2-4]|uniref:Uncharacterized protein n=1 Tax=Nocardiopsis suaedae TaxID=3018444 RepID=A0ABT4TPL7_9ACTN|nr:hypothetical protein [Nocardiopsis suaedae]MDA2806627.1 hypothetical protein [Nocardiopsis suaedae]
MPHSTSVATLPAGTSAHFGPSCPSCAHRSCRALRARDLPRLGGHRSEYAAEHARAAAVQARHPHLIIYFGEHTHSYWAATPSGLIEAPDTDALLLALFRATRPRVRGAAGVPASAPTAGLSAPRVPRLPTGTPNAAPKAALSAA